MSERFNVLEIIKIFFFRDVVLPIAGEYSECGNRKINYYYSQRNGKFWNLLFGETVFQFQRIGYGSYNFV